MQSTNSGTKLFYKLARMFDKVESAISNPSNPELAKQSYATTAQAFERFADNLLWRPGFSDGAKTAAALGLTEESWKQQSNDARLRYDKLVRDYSERTRN